MQSHAKVIILIILRCFIFLTLQKFAKDYNFYLLPLAIYSSFKLSMNMSTWFWVFTGTTTATEIKTLLSNNQSRASRSILFSSL